MDGVSKTDALRHQKVISSSLLSFLPPWADHPLYLFIPNKIFRQDGTIIVSLGKNVNRKSLPQNVEILLLLQ